jgi:hypothetical protein
MDFHMNDLYNDMFSHVFPHLFDRESLSPAPFILCLRQVGKNCQSEIVQMLVEGNAAPWMIRSLGAMMRC